MEAEQDSFGWVRRLLATVANALVAAWRWGTAVIEIAPEGTHFWDASHREIVTRDLGVMQWRADEPESAMRLEAARLGWAFLAGANMAGPDEPTLEIFNGEDRTFHPPMTPPMAYRAVGRASVPTVVLRKRVSLRKRLDVLGMPLRQRRAAVVETAPLFRDAHDYVVMHWHRVWHRRNLDLVAVAGP